MLLRSAVALAALAFVATSQSAAAADQTYTFTGDDSHGAFTASIVLDVVGGQAVSGSDGTIAGAGINGAQGLFLLTGSSADAQPSGSGYLKGANDGTNIVFDTAIPIDSANGLAFTIGAVSTGHDDQPIFNIYGDSGSSSGYTSFFAGRPTTSALNQTFYGGGATDVTVADVSVSAAPEPGSWALMMLGVGAIGAMLGYRKRVIVDHKAKLAAIC